MLIHVRCMMDNCFFAVTHTLKYATKYARLKCVQHKLRSYCRIPMTLGLVGITKTYDHSEIRKSKWDKRKYRGLELANGMKVLLIHDPDTDKSSAAMDVHVGCMKDPRDLPGLAHFCEHMLFLGTTKYPREDDFRGFLSAHGGSFNASTGLEHTNYHFNISSSHLAGAFDRFAQFFISPLFNASAVEREVNAVDNEHRRNLQTDAWRLQQIKRSLARPNHDLNKFGSGNKLTLDTLPKERGIDVRASLLTFHATWYSANIMGCCVLGRESLDTLQDMVVKALATVEDKRVDIPRWDEPPFTESELPVIVSIVPVKDIREMKVTWPIPDVTKHFREKPDRYLGHLLGHEGKGSLLSELKDKGWAMSLSAGQSTGANGFGFFDVSVVLTEEGQDHVDDILYLIYQYIHFIRSKGPQEWIFDECKTVEDIKFQFKDKDSPETFTSSLARKLQRYPIEDVISNPYIFEKFDKDLITQVLSKLIPSNMRVYVLSKQFEGKTDSTEKWYGTQYKVDTFTEEQLQNFSKGKFNEKLHFPERNKFLPGNFHLVPRETDLSKHPRAIISSPSRRLWFKQDTRFLKPKACVSLDLMNPRAYSSPSNTVMNYLFVRLFHDSFTEESYMSDLAGLYYGVTNTARGLRVTVKGYNDKLESLLETVLEKMTKLSIDPVKLSLFKEDYERKLVNFNADQPYNQASFYTTHLTLNSSWNVQELHSAIKDVDVEQLETFVEDSLSNLYIEGLIYGNVTKEQSIKMFATVDDILVRNRHTEPIDHSQVNRSRELRLTSGCYHVRREENCVHENYSTEVYLQCGPQNSLDNVLLELVAHVVKEPAFSVLRTQEQLGYIVFSGVRRSHGTQGLRFLVQSALSSEYVEYRIEAFVEWMNDSLKNMSDEKFNAYKESLVKARLRRPKSIHFQNSQYWNEIVKGTYHFNRDTTEVELLKKVTKDDLYKFYQDNLRVSAPHRRKLVVHVIPADKCEFPDRDLSLLSHDVTEDCPHLSRPPVLPRPSLITDVPAFKRRHGLYPAPTPFNKDTAFTLPPQPSV